MHLKAIEAHLKQNGKLPVNMQDRPRGRRGSRVRQPRRLHQGPQGRTEVRRRRHLRLADVRSRHPVDLLRAARASSTSRSTCAARRATCTPGSFGGAVANPAMVLAPDPRADEGQAADASRFPASMTTCGSCETRSGRECKKLPFNETRYAKELGAPKLFGESGYTTLERVWARPDVRGQRPARGIHRRRRQDRDPGGRRWRKSACASCRIRIRTRSRSSSRTT